MSYIKENLKTFVGYHEVFVFTKNDRSINFYLYIDEYYISTDTNAILFYRYSEPVACIDLNIFKWEFTND